MEYLWKGDMFHVSEALLISVRIRKYIQCFLMNSWPAYFFSTFCLKIIFKLRPFRSKTPQKIKFKQELPMLILIPFLTVLLYIYPYNKQLIKYIIKERFLLFPSKERKEGNLPCFYPKVYKFNISTISKYKMKQLKGCIFFKNKRKPLHIHSILSEESKQK